MNTQWRVVAWTSQGKRHAEIRGRYDNGIPKFCWVASHGTMTKFEHADAVEICEAARASGERAKIEAVH